MQSEDFWQVLLAASKADASLDRAVTAGEPAHVAKYAFQLAQAFNNFYHLYPIIHEQDREKKVFLLWMTDFFRAQLERTLGVLGIEVPPYMYARPACAKIELNDMATKNSFGASAYCASATRLIRFSGLPVWPRSRRRQCLASALFDQDSARESAAAGRRPKGARRRCRVCGARRDGPDAKEISFMPARVLLQDFTGVPAVVDLAAMRDALAAMGADPALANPLLPADLVIDHSVQVDEFGTKDAFSINALLEFQRNRERYMLLRWGQTAFKNFRVVPPDTGIVHQVNLEYLASVVFRKQTDQRLVGVSRFTGRNGFAHHHGERLGRARLGCGRH